MVALGPVIGKQGPDVQTCQHLAPLEEWLAEIGVPLSGGRPCPHDAEWGTWHIVNAPLHVRSLRRRLALDRCVIAEAYEGVLSRSDVTFYCQDCKCAIVGHHPRAGSPGE